MHVCHFVDSLLVIGPLVLFPLQEEFKSMIEDAGFYCVQYYNFTGGVVALHSGFKLWDALRMPSVKYRISKKSVSGFSAVWLYRFFRLEFSSLRLQSAFHLLIAEWPKVREHLWNPEELLRKLLLIDLTVCVLVQMTRWLFFFGNVFWWWIKAKKTNHNIRMDYYQSCKRHINYSL